MISAESVGKHVARANGFGGDVILIRDRYDNAIGIVIEAAPGIVRTLWAGQDDKEFNDCVTRFGIEPPRYQKPLHVK